MPPKETFKVVDWLIKLCPRMAILCVPVSFVVSGMISKRVGGGMGVVLMEKGVVGRDSAWEMVRKAGERMVWRVWYGEVEVVVEEEEEGF